MMSDVIALHETRAGRKGARETKYLKEALLTARRVMEADHPIGEIVGSPGTGKTTAAKEVAEKLSGSRIACWGGITRHQLLRECAAALGIEGHGAVDRMLAERHEADPRTRRMLVVDDANKLTLADRLEIESEAAWGEIMDKIRALVDEAESLPALRDALLSAFGDLPAEKLAEVMAMGFAAAELAGRFAAQTESDGRG